jgi:hypothetical protein
MGTVQASFVTAFGLTLVTYPLDVAQARMTADMSKKPSEFVANKAKVQTGIFI